MSELERTTLDDYILLKDLPREGCISIEENIHHAQIIADYFHEQIKKCNFYKNLEEHEQVLNLNIRREFEQEGKFLKWYMSMSFSKDSRVVEVHPYMYINKTNFAHCIKFEEYFTIRPDSKHRGFYHSKSFSI